MCHSAAVVAACAVPAKSTTGTVASPAVSARRRDARIRDLFPGCSAPRGTLVGWAGVAFLPEFRWSKRVQPGSGRVNPTASAQPVLRPTESPAPPLDGLKTITASPVVCELTGTPPEHRNA